MEYIKIPVICVDSIRMLRDAERGRLFLAVLEYQEGRELSLDGAEQYVFSILKSQIDRDAESRGKERDRKRKQREGQSGTERDKPGQAGTSRDTTGQAGTPPPPVVSPPTTPVSLPPPPKEKTPKGVEKKSPTLDGYWGFDSFWTAYPRKKAKAEAFEAWKRVDPDEALGNRILDAVKMQKLWPQYCGENRRFFPTPAKWLDGGCWDDEPTEGDENPYAKFT